MENKMLINSFVKVQDGVPSVRGTNCECHVWLVTLGSPSSSEAVIQMQ